MVQTLKMTAQVDGMGQLIIEKPLLSVLNKQVKIVVLVEEEGTWLHSLSVNPAFDFLKDDAEDIYTLEDGQPFDANKFN
jgi:bifunctional DNA-binding transcriptional regulator/antitoxin component of YhaV-PrlF toxin-antitoxin module